MIAVLENDMKYKLSAFNITKEIEAGVLIFNTIKQGLMLLDSQHYKSLMNLQPSPDALKKFLQYGFIVPYDYDEISFLKYRNLKAKFDVTRMFVTIETTNACNFRCTYCYQPHRQEYLSESVEKSLLKLVEKKVTLGLRYLHIHWFGGEPLLNFDVIYRLENKLKKTDQIKYSSSITSNGYLITDEMIGLLKKTNVNFFQITVDGDEQVHNKSRVLKNGDGTFSKIISNIKLLVANEIPVVIRYNINKNNDVVSPFLQYLKKEGLSSKVQLHFNEAKKFDICYTDNDIFYAGVEEYSIQLLQIYKELLSNGFTIPRYPMTDVNCEFDCINNFLINTHGQVFQCSSCEHDEQFTLGAITEDGDIRYNDVNYIKKMLRTPFNDEKCRMCKVLPMCMGGCNFLEKKNKNKCIPERYILQDLIELYYHDNNKGCSK